MRGNQCAINSPRFTATSSRGPFQAKEPLVRFPLCRKREREKERERERERDQHTRDQPGRTNDPTSPGRQLFSSAENYFNLLSYPPCLGGPRGPHCIWSRLFPPFSLPFNRASSPTRRKEETLVIYENASITTAPRDIRVVLYHFSMLRYRDDPVTCEEMIFWSGIDKVWSFGWFLSMPSKADLQHYIFMEKFKSESERFFSCVSRLQEHGMRANIVELDFLEVNMKMKLPSVDRMWCRI